MSFGSPSLIAQTTILVHKNIAFKDISKKYKKQIKHQDSYNFFQVSA